MKVKLRSRFIWVLLIFRFFFMGLMSRVSRFWLRKENIRIRVIMKMI